MIHTNEPDTTPIKAYEFATKFPELKIIFAHWDG